VDNIKMDLRMGWYGLNWNVDSIGFWRWCITHRITGFSDFVLRPDSK
jgi:hypothetical protein